MPDAIKLGIENLKKVVAGIATIINVGDAFGADKGVQRWQDLLGLGDLLRQLSSLDMKAVMPELKDLDKAEREVLRQLFETKLDLRDDQLEAVVEDGLMLLEQYGAAYEATVALIAKAKA